MVLSEYPQAELIINDQNVGFATANNQGLRRLGVENGRPENQPRYCLLLNPDTEVPPTTFSDIIDYLDQHQDVGIIGPKLVLPNGELDVACRRAFPTPAVASYRMLGLSYLFPKSRRFGRYNMTFLDEDETAEVDSVVGAFMMLRTEAVFQVGLMDERYWMYGEDLDWAKRVKDAGWKVVYYPEVTVLHVKRASSRQNRRSRVEFYRAMLIFYYKHYYDETPRLLHWLILSGIALKGGRPVYADIAAGPSVLGTVEE
jgi:GT2 family glycosyltransferase